MKRIRTRTGFRPRRDRCSAACMAGAVALAAGRALACPVCDGETGRQVRAVLFDANFVPNLLAVLLPFPLLLGVVAAIHFGWPTLRKNNRAPGRTNDGE